MIHTKDAFGGQARGVVSHSSGRNGPTDSKEPASLESLKDDYVSLKGQASSHRWMLPNGHKRKARRQAEEAYPAHDKKMSTAMPADTVEPGDRTASKVANGGALISSSSPSFQGLAEPIQDVNSIDHSNDYQPRYIHRFKSSLPSCVIAGARSAAETLAIVATDLAKDPEDLISFEENQESLPAEPAKRKEEFLIDVPAASESQTLMTIPQDSASETPRSPQQKANRRSNLYRNRKKREAKQTQTLDTAFPPLTPERSWASGDSWKAERN